jgi:hypothetical protein
MRIHGFTLFLLLGSTTLAATPPGATSTVEEIDVDAMARAKDVKADGSAAPAAAPDAPQDRLETDPATSQPPADEVATDEGMDDEVPAEEAGKADAVEPLRDAEAGDEVEASGEPATPEADSAERRSADACVARAGALLDAAQAHDYEKATRDFDAKMRSALSAAQFQQAWESLAQFGTFTARGQSHPGSHEGYVVVTIPLVFEKANLYAQVSCGSDGRIAGFYVKPLQLPAQ